MHLFNKESYERHQDWYELQFPGSDEKRKYLRKAMGWEGTVAGWLQQLFFNCLNPLLQHKGNWLTVGDAYGFDARYLTSRGSKATATDLRDDFLAIATEEGVVEAYAAQNAENLSYPDNEFDYVLCKESYHHFPRPYAAMYEMIRVAKKGIVIIEPQDPVLQMPLLLLLQNILLSFPKLLRRIWKNRFSHEPVGNFVYKISRREMEKFAAGLHLPMVAFKTINPHFYFKGSENILLKEKHAKFRAIRIKKGILDQLTRWKIIPGQVLSVVVFKQLPDVALQSQLRSEGYALVHIPDNPYR